MNAAAVDNVGILKLKMLVTVNIKTKFPRGIEAGLSVEVSKALCEISMTSNCLESDQAISDSVDPASGVDSVRPGPGLKLQAREDSTANSTRGQVAEPQASSAKQQASSESKPEPSSGSQASSDKL